MDPKQLKQRCRQLSDLAMAHFEQKQYAPALQIWQWCLSYTQTLGDFRREVAIQNNIACCLQALERYAECINLCQALITVITDQFGKDHSAVGQCRRRIERCRRAQSEQRASRLFSDALALYKRGDFAGAVNTWEAAAKAKLVKDDQWEALRLMNQAAARYGAGQFTLAAALICKAEKLVKDGSVKFSAEYDELFQWHLNRIKLGFENEEAHKLLGEARTAFDTGNIERAESLALEALDHLDRCCSVKRDCFLGARVLDLIATCCNRDARYIEARDYWVQAKRLADKWAAKEQSDLPGRIAANLTSVRSRI